MRFRTQMLLAFVPFFLLLGASSETVLALLEHRELRWGLEEEVSSLAVALGEFLGDRPITTPNPAATGPINWEESVGTSLQRSRLISVDIFARDGRTLLRHFGNKDATGITPADPETPLAGLAQAPWALSRITGEGDLARQAAWVALRRADGTIVGYLAAQVSAEGFLRDSATALRRIKYGAAASVLAGLLAIGLVVLPVTRGTRELQTAADQARTGEPLATSGGRLIREIGDLGETFGAMSVLLGEAMDQTRRNLVENEQLRTNRDLAIAFNDLFSTPLSIHHGRIEVDARLAGSDAGGAFWACRRIGDTIWALTGTVAEPDPLQQAAIASATRGYVEDALTRTTAELALAEVAAVLPLAEWSCIAWPLDGGPCRRWVGREGRVTEPVVTVNAAGPACLHTFSPDCQPTIDTCLAGFAGLSAKGIADNICRMLGSSARGALVVMTVTAANSTVRS